MLNLCKFRSAGLADAHCLHSCIDRRVCALARSTPPASPCCHTNMHDACHMRRHALRQQPSMTTLLRPAASSSRAHCRHSNRSGRKSLRCQVCQQRDAAVTAGIPLSGEVLTAPGQRLIEMLLSGSMQHFVPAVIAALQEVGSGVIGQHMIVLRPKAQGSRIIKGHHITIVMACHCSSLSLFLRQACSPHQIQAAYQVDSRLHASARSVR